MYLHLKYPCGFEMKLFSFTTDYAGSLECPIHGKDCKKVN